MTAEVVARCSVLPGRPAIVREFDAFPRVFTQVGFLGGLAKLPPWRTDSFLRENFKALCAAVFRRSFLPGSLASYLRERGTEPEAPKGPSRL